jgi:hypothetical protein
MKPFCNRPIVVVLDPRNSRRLICRRCRLSARLHLHVERLLATPPRPARRAKRPVCKGEKK